MVNRRESATAERNRTVSSMGARKVAAKEEAIAMVKMIRIIVWAAAAVPEL